MQLETRPSPCVSSTNILIDCLLDVFAELSTCVIFQFDGVLDGVLDGEELEEESKDSIFIVSLSISPKLRMGNLYRGVWLGGEKGERNQEESRQKYSKKKNKIFLSLSNLCEDTPFCSSKLFSPLNPNVYI
tara:strand:- start:109 stop:501 length:393 start_codon:yes stop_codon:yes gene_type:complete